MSVQVLLALHGSMGRSVTSKWLQKNGVVSMEASEWNGLTQILRVLFHARSSAHNNGFDANYSVHENLKSKLLSIQEMRNPVFVIAVDIELLDLSTDIWKEQLNFLHRYFGRAKFVWILNHDSSNTIKMELCRKGHTLTVNKPLYKTKMLHILETITKERSDELQKKNMTTPRATVKEGYLHESLEIDYTQCDVASSDGSDISETGGSNPVRESGDKQREKEVRSESSSQHKINNLAGLANGYKEDNNPWKEELCESSLNSNNVTPKSSSTKQPLGTEGEDSEYGETRSGSSSSRTVSGKKSLEGLRILLAEDTPVIQRVATIMLEKMGAIVVAVGDGQQAVDALNGMPGVEDCRRESIMKERNTRSSQTEILSSPPYDLILMDCQVKFVAIS